MSEAARDSASTRPLDISASARRSRGSHSFRSSHTSTQSWVQSHQNPPPPPTEPIRGIPSPIPLLRPVNPDIVQDEEEYMNIQPSDLPHENTLGLHVVNTTPKPKRRFVGGFMTNVKRAFRRREPARPVLRRPIVEDGGSGGSHQTTTLPRYASTPPSPSDIRMPAAQPFYLSVNQAPEALATRKRRVNYVPSPARAMESTAPSPTEIPVDYTRDSAMPASGHPISRPTSVPPFPLPILSPHPSQRHDSALLSPHPSRHSHNSHSPPAAHNASHPASIQAHPPLADDYRRMSLSKQGGTSSGGNGSEPSFETELNPVHRFFSTLNNMPWMSSERITVDYLPGIKRGAWSWKWARTGPGREDRVLVHVPVRKPARPWYTGKQKTGVVEQPQVIRGAERRSSWATRRDEPLDMLSSGGSTASPLSITSGTTASRDARHRPQRRRKSYVIFPDVDVAARPVSSPKSGKRRHHKPAKRHHHKEDEHKSRTRTPPLYPHGYMPAPTPPSSTGRRAHSPVPTVTPAFYLMTHPPPPQAPGSSSQHQPTSSSPPPAFPGQFPYLTPVYMQMLPPTGALSDVSSSPGMAGRGAGYGYSSMAMPIPLPAQH